MPTWILLSRFGLLTPCSWHDELKEVEFLSNIFSDLDAFMSHRNLALSQYEVNVIRNLKGLVDYNGVYFFWAFITIFIIWDLTLSKWHRWGTTSCWKPSKIVWHTYWKKILTLPTPRWKLIILPVFLYDEHHYTSRVMPTPTIPELTAFSSHTIP